MRHVPVLLESVLELLDPRPGEVFVDATVGLGGHASAIGAALGPGGTLVLNDADPGNLALAQQRVRDELGDRAPQLLAWHGNFAAIPDRLDREGLRADGLLADLGFASSQVDDPSRGLSFRAEGPLDMRLDPGGPVTAADLVNETDEKELADLIWRYGEERHSRRIARKVVEARRSGPISTTTALAEIVRRASPSKPGRIDAATRTFQALRIVVNDELGSLEALLAGIRRGSEAVRSGRGGWLSPGARVGMIAFHSLEDRPVKLAFRELAQDGLATLEVRKPVRAEEAEIGLNPRARSAKLRAVRVGPAMDRGPSG